MEKRWHIPDTDEKFIRECSQSLGISAIMAQILYNRQIRDAAQAAHFLHDTMADLADPFLMKGMRKAAERILKAISKKESIVIYGDYDVDGMTSVSILYSVLRELGAEPDFYIPARQSEGYGLNEQALQQLQSAGVQLLITVDCGIASHDLIEKFCSVMDIIVTDHHEPPPQIPEAFAVLNPKQPGCPYPYKELAGTGVAYKLAQALWHLAGREELPGCADLCALGTIADLVPLTGENRILVKAGLTAMRQKPRTGIAALLDSSGLSGSQVTAGRIAFTVAPRLNAAGRISHARKGVGLLLESDPARARKAADELSGLNQERQAIEREITAAALRQIEDTGHGKDDVLIAYGEGWHPGVIGIAASRLVEKLYRPSLVISLQNGTGKGSCRSIAGFNIYAALQSAQDLLLQFGGHPMAAGFSIAQEKIEPFRRRLLDYAAQHMRPEDYVPVLNVDRQLAPQDISLGLIEELGRLEPYGMGNSRPVFSLRQALVSECRPVGRTRQHIRLGIDPGAGGRLTAVGWSMAERFLGVLPGDRADLAFQLEKNEYNGLVSAQLVVQDIHAQAEPVVLNRSVMIDMYLALKRFLPERGLPPFEARQRLIEAARNQYSAHTACAALQVLREIGVLAVTDTAEGPALYFPALGGKMDLGRSAVYRKYYRAEGEI